MLPHSTRTEEARPGHGEDRIAEIRMPGRTLFVVADGAGGAAGGADAAEAICRATSAYQDWRMPSDWAGWLGRVDYEMSRSRVGLAAAVVIEIWDDGRIVGASVGDCEAWMFGGGAASRSLTAGQAVKPLLGEGTARPVGFEARLGRGTLLIATDGLWKYMEPRPDIQGDGDPAARGGVLRARRRGQAQERGVAGRRRDRAGRDGLTGRPGVRAAERPSGYRPKHLPRNRRQNWSTFVRNHYPPAWRAGEGIHTAGGACEQKPISC